MWKHLVFKGECLFDADKNKPLPDCCNYGVGVIGYHCFSYEGVEGTKYCPYLSLSEAKNTLVLVDETKNVVIGKSINYADKVQNKSWLNKQFDYIMDLEENMDD